MIFTGLRLLAVIAVFCGLFLAAPPAMAHNSLDGSDPAERSELAIDGELSLRFAKDVPLETVSVDATDGVGKRTRIAGLRHGTSAREVIVPLAGLATGALSIRWRLVGPDGHVVTDRLRYTLGESSGGISAPSGAPAAPDDAQGSAFGSIARWVVRLGAYLALLAGVGVLVTARFVWPGVWAVPRLRTVPPLAMVAVAVLAFVQLTQLAGAIVERPWWRAVGQLDVAVGTSAGSALLARLIIAAAAAALLTWGMPRLSGLVGDLTLGGMVIALLATWAFAGHARTLRWPVLGVPVDVFHHLAAAAWLGGLVVVGVVGLRILDPPKTRMVMQRFARVAAVSVTVLVVTGALGAVRFIDSPGALVDPHNRVLAAKLVVVSLMLAAGNVNRKRVLRWSSRDDLPRPRQVARLQRAMTTEFVVGIITLAMTAALVVTTPAIGR